MLSTPLSTTVGADKHSVLLPDLIGELLNLIVDVSLLTHQFVNLSRSVHDCGVVSSTESITDLGQREVCEISCEIHGYLPRIDDVLRSFAAHKVCVWQGVEAAHLSLYGGKGYGPG